MKSLINKYIEEFDTEWCELDEIEAFKECKSIPREDVKKYLRACLKQFGEELIGEIENGLPKLKKLGETEMSFSESAGFNTCLNETNAILGKIKYDYPQENTNDEEFSMGQNNQGII